MANIKSITVQVGEKDVVLTLEEAKALHSELSKLFSPPAIINIPQAAEGTIDAPYNPGIVGPWISPYDPNLERKYPIITYQTCTGKDLHQ